MESSDRVEEVVEVIEVVDDIIEIEIYVKEGRQPPFAKGYVIRVDKQKITVHKHEITGREILQLAQKLPPENYILREIFSGGHSQIVGLNQIVDLHRHKIEKFRTLPRDQTEG